MEGNATDNSSKPESISPFVEEYVVLFVELCGILGSSFLLAVLIVYRNSTKITVPFNIAMCSLLANDLCFLILVVPNDIYLDFKHERLIYSNEFACYILYIYLTTLVSIQGYIKSIISAERVFTIAVPSRVKLLVTRRRITIAMIVVSLAMLVLRILYTVFGYEFAGEECVFRGDPKDTSLVLLIIDAVVFCAVPSVVFLIYTCSLAILLSRRRALCRQRSPDLSMSDVRLSLMLVGMDLLYILTSLPFVVHRYHDHMNEMYAVSKWKEHRYHLLSRKFTRLAASSDWLVLLCFGTEIRQAAVRLICHCRDRDPTPSPRRRSHLFERFLRLY